MPRQLTWHGHLHSIEPKGVRDPSSPVPLVKLGAEFASIRDYERRFKGPVDVRDLEHLTVAGDVYFGSGMMLKVRFTSHFGPVSRHLAQNQRTLLLSGNGHNRGKRGKPHRVPSRLCLRGQSSHWKSPYHGTLGILCFELNTL